MNIINTKEVEVFSAAYIDGVGICVGGMFLPPPLIVSFPGGTNKFLSFYS
jgi:hypothetical protein